MALRKEVRAWVDATIAPHVDDWDKAKSYPPDIYRQMGEKGYLGGYVGLVRLL